MSDIKIIVTAHAKDRALVRFGWSVGELVNKAISALYEGMLPSEDEFLADLYEDTMINNPHSVLYYHEGVVYVFDEDRLVTLYGLTGRYRKRG